MNRHEAKMVAEELHRLMNDSYHDDEFLTKPQLAERLQVSESTISHMAGIPKVNIGKAVRYPLNRVINFLQGRN